MKNSTDNITVLTADLKDLRATIESAQTFATAVCAELQRVQKENSELLAWVAGVEADNKTLRNEIARLRASETLVARTVRENTEKILSRGPCGNSSLGADLILMKRRNYKGDLELQRLANDAMTRH